MGHRDLQNGYCCTAVAVHDCANPRRKCKLSAVSTRMKVKNRKYGGSSASNGAVSANVLKRCCGQCSGVVMR